MPTPANSRVNGLGPIARALVVAAGFVAALHPLPGRADLTYPRSGLVCDTGTSICYDASGASVVLTERYLGSPAARNLRRSLDNGLSPTQFVLGNGTACDVTVRTCWNDGWKRRNIDHTLSRRLFGSAAGSPSGSVIDGTDGRRQALCSLSQRALRVIDGPCQLRVDNVSGRSRFQVTLDNGPRYTFVDRGDGFRITDDMGGSWPVTFVDHGPTGIFRWAENKLVVTRRDGLPPTRSSGTLQPSTAGEALGELLRTLFR
jgi:uncharacterized protein (DUF779 family)